MFGNGRQTHLYHLLSSTHRPPPKSPSKAAAATKAPTAKAPAAPKSPTKAGGKGAAAKSGVAAKSGAATKSGAAKPPPKKPPAKVGCTLWSIVQCVVHLLAIKFCYC